MTFLDEQAVEGLLLETFVALGYERQSDTVIGPDGECAERTSHGDVILMERLKAAVARLNPDLPEPVREEAIRKLTLVERPSILEENRRLHRALVEGVKVEHRDAEGR